jgi:hypothetical protein
MKENYKINDRLAAIKGNILLLAHATARQPKSVYSGKILHSYREKLLYSSDR